MQTETESYRWAGTTAAVRAALRNFQPASERELKSIYKALLALADYPDAANVSVDILNRGTAREHVLVGPVNLCS